MNANQGPHWTKVFKFKWKVAVIVVATIFIVVILSAAIPGYIQEGGLGMLVLAIVLCLVAALITVCTCIGRSDIIVTDQYISRRLFGKTIRSISWDNIKLIRVFPTAKWDNRKSVRGYGILSRAVDATRPRTRMIYFGDYGSDLSELISVLNLYISKYQIPVDRIINGEHVKSTSI